MRCPSPRRPRARRATVASAPTTTPRKGRSRRWVRSRTAAHTKTSTRLCFTSAPHAPAAPASRPHPKAGPGPAGPEGRDGRGEAADQEGQAEQLAVDDGAAEERAGRQDGSGRGRQHRCERYAGGGQPADEAGEEHGQDERRDPEQAQRPGAVGQPDQGDQQRGAVDEVVAVQRGAGRPLVGQHQQAALVRTQRPSGERQPDDARGQGECGDPGRGGPQHPATLSSGCRVSRRGGPGRRSTWC